MTSDVIPACSLAVTTAELSAWLDDDLPPSVAARIAQHVADCPACQRRADAYRADAEALRAMPEPEPIGGYGHNPRPRAGAPGVHPHTPLPRPRLRLGGGLAALAAVLLLALAFGQLFHTLGDRATLAPTPTPAPRLPTAPPAFVTATPGVPPASAARWQPRALPVAGTNGPIGSFLSSPTVAFAQSDGNVAYECVSLPGNTTAQVWLTRDGAAHWQRMADLPTHHVVDNCVITVDTTDPALAVAETYFSPPGNCGDCAFGIWTDFVTTDFGSHWANRGTATFTATSATGDDPFPISAFTSYQGAVYALHIGHGSHFENPDNAVLVSRDGMRTWTRFDTQLPASDLQGFWLNPANGSVLVLANPNTSMFSMQLWTSDDGGAHWRQISYPFGAFVAVQAPFAAQPWHLCVWDTSTWYLPGNGVNTTNTHAQDLACSSDSGATWVTRHIANLASYAIAGISDDGSVLLTDEELYRLVPGQITLEPLGALPVDAQGPGNVAYVAALGAGRLWAGPFVPSIFGNMLNQPGPLAIAAYA